MPRRKAVPPRYYRFEVPFMDLEPKVPPGTIAIPITDATKAQINACRTYEVHHKSWCRSFKPHTCNCKPKLTLIEERPHAR